MNVKQFLLIDLIKILPDGIDCYIQAPSLEDDVILNLMSPTKYEYYKCMKLKGSTKEMFVNRISNYPIEEYFQSIEIKLNDKLLFEGYDGVEFGVISKSIELPEWFKDKHVKTGMCNISNEW